jgi:hypothetical protein
MGRPRIIKPQPANVGTVAAANRTSMLGVVGAVAFSRTGDPATGEALAPKKRRFVKLIRFAIVLSADPSACNFLR